MEQDLDIYHHLRLLPCLSGLNDKELSIIAGEAELKKVFENDMLFAKSDPVKFFFIVEKGSIKLYKTSKEGKELLIKIFRSGDHFCLPLHKTNGSYLVNAIALEDSSLVVIPAEKFTELLNSAVSETGLRIIAGLCERIKILSNFLEDIAFDDVEHRVIKILLRLAEEKSSKDNIVHLTTTHHDIATMTGTVREVVSRTMSKLKKEGIIFNSASKGFKVNKTKLQDLHRDPPLK